MPIVTPQSNDQYTWFSVEIITVMSSRRRSWTQVGDNQLEGATKIIPSAKKFLSRKQREIH